MADVAEPLLGEKPQRPSSETRKVELIFAVVGLATSIVWNQLMLCVQALVELFGNSALATAATSQNALCAAAMIAFTVLPLARHYTSRLRVCMGGFAVMMALGAGFTVAFQYRELPAVAFLLAVAVNGICTGTVQSLAASLSGSYPHAPGALLLGESCASMVAVATSLVVRSFGLEVFTESAVCLVAAQTFLLAALLALAALSGMAPTTTMDADTLGACLTGTNPEYKEYAIRRLGELVGNSVVAFVACMMWVFLLCSTPFMATGLCGSDEECAGALPALVISAANLSAVLGRCLGLRLRNSSAAGLLAEAALLAGGGLAAVRLCVLSAAPAGGLWAFVGPARIGASIGVAITVWSNCLLMRNDHNAQAGCGHSVLAPCPVTTQVTWIAIQLGSIAGTLLAGLW